MSKFSSKSSIWVVALFLFLGFYGCASIGRRDTDVRLKERAKGFWEARKNNDMEAQYRYDVVSRTKKVSLTDYMRKRAITDVLGFEIGDAHREKDKDKATVDVKIDYLLLMPGFPKKKMTTEFKDLWVFIDGDWYRQQRGLLQRQK